MNKPLDENSFADGIVEIGAYEAPSPEKKHFLPWHRPRKQFVRENQWCKQIDLMLQDAPRSDDVLKYLGLPGVDLLDLRHFHSVICVKHNLRLRFLGFNSSASPSSKAHVELNISLDEVRRLDKVDTKSACIGDNFSLIANKNSIAFQKTHALGPYDVINLDLCDGFSGQEPSGLNNNTYYNAVNSLLTLQARYKNPWLLLLTTRADRSNIDHNVLQTLLCKYNENLKRCPEFLKVSSEEFSIEAEHALKMAVDTPCGLLQIFLTGLYKWFLSLALAQNPPTSIELRSVIGYRVNQDSEHEDLISLALRFTPTLTPTADPAGLSRLQSKALNECKLSAKALRRVAKRVDADKVLADDTELNQRMTDATAKLLSLARYDVNEYEKWLEMQPR